jgi:hypothetical protein
MAAGQPLHSPHRNVMWCSISYEQLHNSSMSIEQKYKMFLLTVLPRCYKWSSVYQLMPRVDEFERDDVLIDLINRIDLFTNGCSNNFDAEGLSSGLGFTH